MSHRKLGWCAAFAGAALLFTPGVSEAQVRFSIGVTRGNVGFYAGNAPYYRGLYPGAYPGYYGYGRSGFSFSIGTYPYRGYYPGYAYSPLYTTPYYTPYTSVPRYSAGYYPYYGGSSASYSVQVQPPRTYQALYPPAETPMTRVDNTAAIELHVLAAARVWFNGTETKQTGTVRRFVSPELTPGYDYSYTIRAAWTENGREVSQERQVVVQAGGQFRVDLTGESLSSPKKIQP